MNKFIIGALILISAVAVIVWMRRGAVPLPAVTEEMEVENRAEVIAENLNIPWSLAFLPDGVMLVTERPGRIKRISQTGSVEIVADINEVAHVGEGGLMGMALHPDFAVNQYVYVYYTYAAAGNDTMNRVARYTLRENGLTEPEIIVNQIPGASNHNGGRIKFGPDGFLYIGTGDAQEPSLAQDTTSLAGKVLRVTDAGEPAPGNPFGNEIYSYGHRNVQGLAWDEQQRLWATEHGPQANDEVNLIEAGGNYGWPVIQGSQTRQDMRSPVVNSGRNTWAPSGMTIVDGTIYFAGLRGSALFSFNTDNNSSVTSSLGSEYGRLRDVVNSPGGDFYIMTNNGDGRGRPAANDDRIIRIKLPFASE